MLECGIPRFAVDMDIMDKSMDTSVDISKPFKLNCHITSVIRMHWKTFREAGVLLTKQRKTMSQ